MRKKRKARKRLALYLRRLGAFLSWLAWLGIVIFLPPSNKLIIVVFLGLFFWAVWLTGFSFLGQARWASLGAFFLTGLVVLQLFRQLHWLNLILLLAFSLALFFGWRERA